jgi:hypothetical protein
MATTNYDLIRDRVLESLKVYLPGCLNDDYLAELQNGVVEDFISSLLDKVEEMEKDPEWQICERCGARMIPVMENVGFTAPDPVKYEVTGYKCETCGGTK